MLLELDVLLTCLYREALGHVGSEPGKIETFLLDCNCGDLAAREVEQIVGKLTHPRAFLEYHLQQLAALQILLRRILAAQQFCR